MNLSNCYNAPLNNYDEISDSGICSQCKEWAESLDSDCLTLEDLNFEEIENDSNNTFRGYRNTSNNDR